MHPKSKRSQPVERTCAWCKQPFMIEQARLKRGEGICCSRACSIAKRRHDREQRFEERFWSKVDQAGGSEACWPWVSATDRDGYGVFTIAGEGAHHTERAHRVAWSLARGPIPDNAPVIMHTCDNPPCCNPSHLRPGTLADNNRDRAKKGRSGYTGKPGEEARDAKLTNDDVREIRSLAASGVGIREIARRYSVAHTTISNAVNRKTWRHIE